MKTRRTVRSVSNTRYSLTLVVLGFSACVTSESEETATRSQPLSTGSARASDVELLGQTSVDSGAAGSGSAGEGGSWGSAGSAGNGGTGGGEDKKVETVAIQKVLDCINGKAKDKKLEPADFVECFKAEECTYELVMSEKSLHRSCYSASDKKCELPRVILNCGKDPKSWLASFNLCPYSPNHVEVAEQVATHPDFGRILGMSKFPFPWDKQRVIGDVLIQNAKVGEQGGCFGGRCHSNQPEPKLANDGVPYTDTLPFPESIISKKTLADVCKCLTDEKFDKIVFYPNFSDDPPTVDVTKENLAIVRALCGAFGKVEFKQKEPPKKP